MASHPAMLAWPQTPQGELGEDELGLALWTAPAIEAATGGHASADFAVSGVAFDSREVHEGDLFVALRGEQSDGHGFVAQALARGAAAVLVEAAVEGPHVLVSDTSSALEGLAKAARERADAHIIGVTGSAGKTGVKEALFAALDRSSRGRAHRSVKSYNNHVGVPLSLARMSARTKFGVFEMGMNHAGELSALTRLVRPHVAVVTTIAPAHIGFFANEEEIADAKGEIFEGLLPGGTAIIPADNRHYERLRAKALACGARVVSFGTAPHADVRLLDTIRAHNGGSLITADFGDRRICYTVSLPGEHWVLNSLAVMAAVRAVGGDLGAAGLALAELEGLTGRGAHHAVAASGGDGSGGALVIDESYNANPASMAVTIAELGRTPARRRIAVLGAMKELGTASDTYHAAISEPLIAAKIDRVVLVGEEMAPLARALSNQALGNHSLGNSAAPVLGQRSAVAPVANAVEALALVTADKLEGGDAVLVKGSNSVGLAALVKALAKPQTGGNQN